jgi:periplasmic protein TonB
MHLSEPSRRPPLIGLAVAISLHLALLVSVQVTASKNSLSDMAFTPAAAMAVRTIELPSATVSTVAVAVAAAPSQILATEKLISAIADAGISPPKTTAPAVVQPAGAALNLSTVVSTPPAAASPAKPEALVGLLPQAQPAAAPEYRSAGTLDPGPKPLGDINPDYPARAGQQQGLVVLRLLINEQGVVDNVAVVRASPAGYFEESALDAFGKALFSPGKLLGVAVKSQITVEVEFMPINRGATVSGRTY